MKIVSIINTKGGVGKTVTAVHLGAALAKMGKRVLLLDVDLQHGLTTYFSVDDHNTTMVEVLLDGAPLDDATREIQDNLWLAPSSAKMESAEVELASAPGGEVRLRRAFRRFKSEAEVLPDYILIDCAGSWGAVARNALLASDAFIVPVNSEPASVHTALATIGAARELGEYHDHDLQLLGVLVTRFRHTKSAQAVLESTRRQWPEEIFESVIRQAEKINEYSIRGAVFEDGNEHAVALDYSALAQEVVSRGQS